MSEEQKAYELKVTDKRPQFDESPSLPVSASPNAVVMMAMQKNYTPELIEKMMALQERNDANEARKAYFEAVAAFKAEAPPVKKDKYNTFFKSNYTSLGNLLGTYNPVLGRHGLSVSFPTPEQTDTSMTVECRLAHRMGHTEVITMTAPIDKASIGKQSGERSRNPLQDIKSTFTYLRSATCEAILGVAGTEGTVDDDGNSAGGNGKMTLFEKWEIKATEVCEGAQTLEDIIQWWPDNSAQIKKELKKPEAAKIYDLVVLRKKELEKAERIPGEEG